MAENENILTRLGKLFQSSIVLRKTPSWQIKVKDVDFSQTAFFKTDEGVEIYTAVEKRLK